MRIAIPIIIVLFVSTVEVLAAKPEGGDGGQLAQLGTSLKAAVLSGSMTEEDARAIWESAGEVRKLQAEMETLLADGSQEEVGEDAKSQTLRLIPPDPRSPRLLLQPEFLKRDSLTIIESMELDPQRSEIVDLVFRDYVGSYELISQPLVTALQRYRRSQVGRDLAEAVDRLDRQLSTQDIDMTAAMDTMQERLEEYARQAVAKQGAETEEGREKSRALAQEWVAELEGGLDSLDENMNRLRERLVIAIEQTEQAGSEVTPEDLYRLATALRQQRDAIRTDVLETLQLTIAEDGDQERLAGLRSAMQRLQFTSGLRLARLGGERIDPRAVLEGSVSAGEPVRMRLVEMEPQLAGLARNRLDTALDRELAGIRLMVEARKAIDEFGGEEFVPGERWERIIDPYADSWQSQIDASVACRDGILDAIDELTVLLMEQEVESAFAYRDLALRRGFPDEMRVRWYDRALAAALELDGLAEEVAAAITELRDRVSFEARAIRDRAIAGRMERDVELANAPVLSLWGLEDDKGALFEESDWRGREFEAHRLLNDEVEDSLRILLDPVQFDRLPPRRWQWSDEAKEKERKAGAKRSGRGKGSGGKGSGGKGSGGMGSGGKD
tara:strand:+ start:10657 stop:12495 length:1839 start_codon:yes stop_codon:yes gene_type:complete